MTLYEECSDNYIQVLVKVQFCNNHSSGCSVYNNFSILLENMCDLLWEKEALGIFIPSGARSILRSFEFVWLLCELLKHRTRLPQWIELHLRLQRCQSAWRTSTKNSSSYNVVLSLNSTRPLNYFSRRLKCSPVLDWSLPRTLVSLAIVKVVDYPLANS